MDLSSPAAVIENNSLENWKVIGAGGFGQVHKARHVVWGLDVAIKLLQCDDGASLHNEAEMMRKGASHHVIRILGVYKDCPPTCGPSIQLGLVMEFMERGDAGIPPGHPLSPSTFSPPLAYRLAHQIALGMNFLHCLIPPLLHQDLKPNNVLLDDYLNAKLADFGLAKVSHSVNKMSKEFPGKAGGTSSYMPPEALENVSYKPIRAFDIYSYGILLWSIITGQSKPYPYVHAGDSSRFCFLIKDRGQRPSLETVDKEQVEGLRDLVELMEKCWDHEPSKRPPFKECFLVTERVFEKHKKGINNAVHQVLTKLALGSEGGSKTSGVGAVYVSASSKPPACPKDKVNISADVKTGSLSPTQDVADGLSSKLIDKDQAATPQSSQDQSAVMETKQYGAQFVDENMEVLIQRITMVMPIADGLYQKKMIHDEDYSEITAAQTSMSKMRKLYVALKPGGEVAKSAFYKILLDQHPLLVKELGGVGQK
ncbi:receptor-interacting serine/threonine-protein kinase 3 isoform X2 [Salmo salar]|uniref:Receptor-interacting serine/threonine-protein kinase 3 isoform X2 n=1 Tax=Salmo salar TaxID=8030 RepID=A0ABM3D2J7_SALSA|nr:receptor-interacting serine/threonine-protein kinase 3-like isoform X2 [Salmo salar]